MRHGRPVLLWVAVLAAGLGLWAGHRLHTPSPAPAAPAQGAPPAPARLLPGEPVPPIRLPDLHGRPVTLDTFRGRPLLVNVWASWCAPCVEEMPELARFARAQGAHGVQVLGLALDSPEHVRAFLQQVPVEYPIVLDTPGPADASVRLGNDRGLLPYTVLIDAQGRLQRQKLGPFAAGEVDRWVNGSPP